MQTESCPEKFPSILRDFLSDLNITFPEYSYLWQEWTTQEMEQPIYNYCLGVYPERFFDILYQNEDIFDKTSEVNTQFLPNVDFKLLFNAEGISEKTKQAIWKYLQLILITIMSGVKDKTGFGETMNLFDGIEEGELQNKLTETIEGLTNFFKTMDSQTENASSENPYSEDANRNTESSGMPNMEDTFKSAFEGMPDAAGIHEHLKGLFDGKIGKLAKELAEEMSGDLLNMFGEDGGEIKNTQDIFKKFMKNPKKIMELMKTVGAKLEAKMKDGDISKEDIMKEASELMGKMKGMGNGKEFQEMMKNLTKNMGGLGGMANMAKGAKFDMGAMQRMSAQYSQKERMRAKLDARKAADGVVLEKKGENTYSFNLEGEEKQEKSVAPNVMNDDWLDDHVQKSNSNNNKNNKKKKSKNKK